MTWRPRTCILVGVALCLAAVALAALGATMRGAFNPECDTCAPWQARILLFLALPIGIYGGVLVAIGIVRAQPADDDG